MRKREQEKQKIEQEKQKNIFRSILEQLDISRQCRRNDLSLWQCPQFLFVLMGFIICATALGSYLIGTRYVSDPALVAIMVLLMTGFLFVIAVLIIRSFERLAEANRMKSEFVSIVSHQLRSPLSNLSWSLDFLVSSNTSNIIEEQKEYFNILEENIKRMDELVSDLLIVSRIQSATLPLNKQEFAPEQSIRKAISEFKTFAKASNVGIKLEVEKDLPKAFADPHQFDQIMKNFIDNGIKYSKNRGEVEISIEKQGKNLYFEIKDSGIGIPEQDQKYIFQKFFRSKNVLRHETQGSGLGLFIAKSAIERSGGKVGFRSQLGKGTTFWFTLPIKKTRPSLSVKP